MPSDAKTPGQKPITPSTQLLKNDLAQPAGHEDTGQHDQGVQEAADTPANSNDTHPTPSANGTPPTPQDLITKGTEDELEDNGEVASQPAPSDLRADRATAAGGIDLSNPDHDGPQGDGSPDPATTDLSGTKQPQPNPDPGATGAPEPAAADTDDPVARALPTFIRSLLLSREPELRAAGIVALAEWAGAVFFHSRDQKPYVRIPVPGGRQNLPLDDHRFKDWLSHLHFIYLKRSIPSAPRRLAQEQFRAQAIFGGPELDVRVRLAGGPGVALIDLGLPDAKVVRVTNGDWEIVDEGDCGNVAFHLPAAMHPLAVPERGGTIAELQALLRLPQDEFVLVVVFMLMAMRHHGPYSLLLLIGEQGSGKSTVAKIIKAILDPTDVPLRAEARNEQDLIIAAQANGLLAVDNLSKLNNIMSDAYCRLSTGGGMGTRTYRTNDQETVMQACRPVLLTAITEVVTRPDLLDRTAMIRVPKLEGGLRRSEAALLEEVEAAKPRLFGALLGVFAAALAQLPHVQLAQPPRMLDYAMMGTAAEAALGLPPGGFMDAYNAVNADAHHVAAEATPVSHALELLMEDRAQWADTATALRTALVQGLAPHEKAKFPKSPKTLRDELCRLLPALRKFGYEIEFTRALDRKRTRLIRIQRVA